MFLGSLKTNALAQVWDHWQDELAFEIGRCSATGEVYDTTRSSASFDEGQALRESSYTPTAAVTGLGKGSTRDWQCDHFTPFYGC